MWTLAARVVKILPDVTVGMVIVLVHAALADRETRGVQLARARQRS